MRVLIADDDPLMRRLLHTVLGAHDGLAVVGEAADGNAALALAASLRPDVVVLDRAMPGLDGIDAARAIRDALPGCRIVIFSGQGADDSVDAAGADRYVEKQDGLDGLADAVLALTPPAA